MLVNGEGKIFVGQRFDSVVEAWQMPQGGIDPGEDPWTAARRELEEETGVTPAHVEKIAETAGWLSYDLPPELRAVLWKGRYIGQRQKWFACRFTGTDADIDIATTHPEFKAWRWADPDTLPDLIVTFKQDLYRALIAELGPHLTRPTRAPTP
ncbi:RNA pyrophosphohydrolase [Sandaracinobacteroides saxicola]